MKKITFITTIILISIGGCSNASLEKKVMQKQIAKYTKPVIQIEEKHIDKSMLNNIGESIDKHTSKHTTRTFKSTLSSFTPTDKAKMQELSWRDKFKNFIMMPTTILYIVSFFVIIWIISIGIRYKKKISKNVPQKLKTG